MTAALQDVQRSGQVAVGVGVRVLDRVAYARLRREVHDALVCALRERRFHGRSVREVDSLEAESLLRLEPGEAGLLERGVVVRVEVVEADDFIAARQQAFGDVVADETGGTRDKDSHQSRPSAWPRSNRYFTS